MLKVGIKVKVHHETHPFTGKIEQAMKWENPFSVFHKKGIDYVVRADDDKQLYKCTENDVTKVSS